MTPETAGRLVLAGAAAFAAVIAGALLLVAFTADRNAWRLLAGACGMTLAGFAASAGKGAWRG